MGRLVFKYSEVRELIEHTLAAKGQSVALENLFDESMWIPGAKPKADGSVDAHMVDRSKLVPSLMIVKDRGGLPDELWRARPTSGQWGERTKGRLR